jgi:CRISPR-associated protein Csm1
MKNNSLIYAAAGLLHDIGKFAQRADGWYEKSEMLSTETKNLAGILCNTSQAGYSTHQHVLWTNEFIKQNETRFNSSGLNEISGENSLINLASYHHRPSTSEQAIITMADYWSSGLDRNTNKFLAPNPDYGKDKFRSVPLLSIFSNLATTMLSNGLKENYGYTLQAFNTTKQIFPGPAEAIDNKTFYKSLWEHFEKEFQKLPDATSSNFIFSLLHLLKLYTWYIPASTMDYPDNSLFEHLKTTGAIAHCLAEYRSQNTDAFSFSGNRLKLKENHYPLLLFCGDISGIQSFIYNVSNKSAMKGLKGRSFYVQLLAETLASEIADACNVSVINIVYAAGGKFYLLLPNTAEVLKKLEWYRYEIQQKIWQEHLGKLSVNMSWIPFVMHQQKSSYLMTFTEDEPEGMPVGELWKLLAEKTGEQKKQKFKNVLTGNFERLFHPIGTGGDVEICSVSGEELQADKHGNFSQSLQLTEFDPEDETDAGKLFVSSAVKEQIELGRQLYNARYLTELKPVKSSEFELGLGTKWKLTEGSQDHNVNKWISINWENAIQLYPEKFTTEKGAALGFKLFGGVRMAMNATENRIKTLEDLCEKNENSNNERSLDHLGVLRMDVDNLGNLFMHGFSKKSGKNETENHASFSALATLSALLDQFFSGYLNTIRNSDTYKDHVNIIYSGGDDVFAVGRWDKLIAFAIEIRNSFKKFVCGRTDISLSAGLVIVGAKFPIAKAADMSGEEEDKGKNYIFKKDEIEYAKNAFTLFGITLNWEYEMPFVVECKNDFVKWIAKDKIISKGFLMKMFDYYQLFKDGKPDWRWQSAYNIARSAKTAKSREEQDCYNAIKQLLFTNNYKNKHQPVSFHALIAACRWAELEIKNLKN